MTELSEGDHLRNHTWVVCAMSGSAHCWRRSGVLQKQIPDAPDPCPGGFAARTAAISSVLNQRHEPDPRRQPGAYASIVAGREWIQALELAPQRELLLALLAVVEADERFRALEVGCSFGRGNADEFSDVDVGLWIADVAWESAREDVDPMLRSLATAIDATGLDRPWGRWFFVQYADGRQLDVAAQRASTAQGRPPHAVVLFDRDGILRARIAGPEPVDRRDEWAFLAWFALGNVPKYLARGSLWEALAALEQARSELLRLHAANVGADNPVFGITSIFDTPGGDVPPGLADTYPRPEPADIRRAANAIAEFLSAAHAEPPLAGWIKVQLQSLGS